MTGGPLTSVTWLSDRTGNVFCATDIKEVNAKSIELSTAAWMRFLGEDPELLLWSL